MPPPQAPTTFCASTIIKLPIVVTTTIDVVKPPPPLVINHATTQPNSPQFVPAKPYNRLISSRPTTSSTSKETGIDELVKNINTAINFVLACKSLDVLPMKLSKPLYSLAHEIVNIIRPKQAGDIFETWPAGGGQKITFVRVTRK